MHAHMLQVPAAEEHSTQAFPSFSNHLANGSRGDWVGVQELEDLLRRRSELLLHYLISNPVRERPHFVLRPRDVGMGAAFPQDTIPT